MFIIISTDEGPVLRIERFAIIYEVFPQAKMLLSTYAG